MTRRTPRRGRLIPILFFTFVAGTAIGWWARSSWRPSAIPSDVDASWVTGTTGNSRPASSSTDASPSAALPAAADVDNHTDPLSALSKRHLQLPIDGADIGAMKGQFGEPRGGGTRGHEAVDILSPRNTPVHAVDDGVIAKLFVSKQGGNTIYQFDPTETFCYYYAHLERYAEGLHDGQRVSRGDVIGYVGTSGNAPPNTPHLHFAIFKLAPEHHWWQGTPLDPWAAFSR